MKKTIFTLSLILCVPLIAQTELPPELVKELEAASANGEGRFFQEFLNMLFMLGLLVGLLYVGTWVFKRMVSTRITQVNETSNIKVLESRAISTKSSIYIIETEGKKFALAESLNGVTALGELRVE